MTQTARDTQVVTKEAKQERERSTIEFPYTSLDDAVEVAKAIQKVGGNEARIESLAAELGHTTTESGGFRQRLAGGRMFGLATSAQGIVTLTALGSRMVDPNTEASARVDAFLTVPLYKSVYEEFKGGTLPPNEGLENKMVALGVAQKQKDRARQAFQRSAKEAGFFAYGNNRLVYPASGSPASSGGAVKHQEKPVEQPKGGTGSGNGGDPPHQNPFIQGLLSKLPSDDTVWSLADRRKWLQLAISVFDVTYKSAPEDSGELSVSHESDSAK